MQKSHLLRSYAFIASFLSAVRAFSVTVGTPTQCDDLAVSWSGKYIHTKYTQCIELYQVDKHHLRL